MRSGEPSTSDGPPSPSWLTSSREARARVSGVVTAPAGTVVGASRSNQVMARSGSANRTSRRAPSAATRQTQLVVASRVPVMATQRPSGVHTGWYDDD